MLELLEAQIKKMKMKSMKSLLKEFLIPCKGCVQKSEYVLPRQDEKDEL